MPKYRKKPVVIEAMEFTEENKNQVFNWITCTAELITIDGKSAIKIRTLEGEEVAICGEYYIIKGVNGEFYPCKSDIFKKTYEKVEN